MSEPFLAEIRMVGFNFAPRGWAYCDGQLLPINQNQSLYSLLGTAYGGDGRTSFALPDLRGRVPVHVDSTFTLGRRGGAEATTLNVAEIPSHDHALQASSAAGTQPLPGGAVLAESTPAIYREVSNMQPMRSDATTNAGGGLPHDNRMPSLAVNFCIALQGLFPSRS